MSLSLSDQIAQCECCRVNAVKVAPNYPDLFNEAWLKIKESELRGNLFRVENHCAFFMRCLINARTDIHRQRADISIDPPMSELPPIAYVEEWCEKRTGNDFDDFFRELLTLVVKCKTHKEVMRMTGMRKSRFYETYEEAKKRIQRDYENDFSDADLDSIHSCTLV